MTNRAWACIWAVLGAAVVSTVAAIFISVPVPSSAWLPLAGLTLLSILAQLFKTEVPGRQSYYPHLVFFFAGVLLLPAALFVPLVAVPHTAEWAKERLLKGPHLRAWYIQPYNIASHLLAGFVAYLVYGALGAHSVASYSLMSVAVVTAAALAYVLVNHLLVGLALVYARNMTWRGTGVLGLDNFLPDFVLSYLGYIVAVLFTLSPWLAVPALAPLALIYRVFMLFRIKRDTLTDTSTGLWNVGHFTTILNAELERARRFSRDLAVIITELDAPGEIEAVYGSVAVDTVFAGLSRLAREGIRQYDMAARFDRRRMVILLPETNPFEALIVARRLQSAMHEASFKVETSPAAVKATVCMGIACFPGDGVNAQELLASAEAAAVHAASRGRGSVVSAADVPRSQPGSAPSGLKLKGEIFAAGMEKQTGFANPALRNQQ